MTMDKAGNVLLRSPFCIHGQRETQAVFTAVGERQEAHGASLYPFESTCQCRRQRFNPRSGKIPHVAEQLSL